MKTEAMRNVAPLRAIKSISASRDTVQCLRHMLGRAERGEIIGISFAAIETSGEYLLQTCGEAHRDAKTASALASALWYQTMKQVFGDD